MSWLPTYYKTHFTVTLEEVGLFSAIPMVVFLIILLSAGLAADILLKQGICSKGVIRRAFQTTAFVCILASLFILSFVKLDLLQTVVMIVFAFASVGFSAGK